MSRTTHGYAGTATYRAWAALLRKAKADVCPEWRRFEAFLADVGEKPEGLVLHWDPKLGVANKTSCAWVRNKSWAVAENSPFFKHGATTNRETSREYRSWQEMEKRCLCTTSRRYSDYGGRGITVCERWLDFPAFLEDMGPCPEGRSLDRIDNTAGYGPGNCRWATVKEQNRNQRSNIWTTFDGNPTKVVDLADRFGLNLKLLRTRILREGMSGDDAVRDMLERPPKQRTRRFVELGGRRMTLTEASEILGVSRTTVYDAAVNNEVPFSEWLKGLTPKP